jgi:four helix bundle protein
MSNEVLDLSFEFAVKSVQFVREMKKVCNEYDLLNQFLRSSTSVGANITEAQYPQSKADFISKMSIARKEANESKYWLRIFIETKIVKKESVSHLFKDLDSILRLLNSIIISAKND